MAEPAALETVEKEIEISPALRRVTCSDQRTEQEKRDGTILFRNLGLMEVSLDFQAFSGLLKEEGMSAVEISTLQITFRAGTAADRNFHGEIIGGWQGGNMIEVYTTLPADKDTTSITNLPIRPTAFIKFLLHEIKHYCQEVKDGESIKTFYGEKGAVLSHPVEIAADIFAAEKAALFNNKFRLLEYDGFENNTGPERNVGELSRCNDIYNLDRKLVLIDPDNPVLDLENDLGEFIAGRVSVYDASIITAKIRELVETGKLGYAEANRMLDDMETHLLQTKKNELASKVREAMYKPQPI